MIVFDLECQGGGHRFEGWFGSSRDFADQQERGLLACPQCGSAEVVKAPMAPSVGRKGNQGIVASPKSAASTEAPAASVPVAGGAMPPEARAMLHAIAAMQAEALKQSKWVGDRFAEDARAIHYGEREHETIHGQATPDEARALVEEGIEIAPLLIPVAPPEALN